MKTRISAKWVMTLALPLALATGSRAQDESPPLSVVARYPAPAATSRPGAPALVPSPLIPSPPPDNQPPRNELHPEAVAGLPSASAADPTDNPPPPWIHLSPWSAEILKLAQAGIEEDVLLTFVDSAGTFNLDSDQIIYLRDLGVPDEVINAMMQHDSAVVAGLRPVTASTVPTSQPLFHLPAIPRFPPPAAAPPTSPTTLPASPASVNREPSDYPNQAFLQNVVNDLNAFESSQAEPFSAEAPAPDPRLALNQKSPTAPGPGEVYPVREPYPVPLSDPIIMIRAEVRPPNVIIIDPLP